MFTQCIKERGMVRLGVHRVSNRNGDHAKIARSLLRQELRTPFDLERSPLVRATLIRIGPEKALLQLVAHPLICDESSLRILARQLRHCCPFAIQSSSSCLDLAHTAYSATSFNGQLPRPSSSELAAGLDFWQSYWAEFGFARLASRNLPFANEFTGRTGKISAAQRFLEPALTSRVLRFAREQRFTLFVLTFAALAVVLSHHCGQDRVALRRRFANRVVGENYRAVGALETIGILGVKVASNARGRDVLESAREAAQVTTKWRHVPAALVGYPAAIAIQECVSLDFRFIPGQVANLGTETNSGPARLLFTEPGPCLRYFVTQFESAVFLTAAYSTALFPDDRIAELLGQLEMTIRFLIDRPDGRIEDVRRLLRSPSLARRVDE
ncbi:MAG TPA: condensation domain-containing protein [Bryobacteraceae bacterium]|nr:condensation domain-containing protein [Bryobacteraceae bacterium]